MKQMAGFAVVAVVGVVLLRVLFSIVGLVFSLLSSLLWIALLGLAFYFVLKIISPSTAERVRDVMRQEAATDSVDD